MFRLIGMLVVLAAILAVIGWYRGWFQVQTQNGQGVHQIDVTVDKARIDQDKAKIEGKVQPDTRPLETH